MITTEYIFNKIENQIINRNISDKAAVLIPIVRKDNQLCLLFEVRSSSLKWQPGDICFPGGRMDKSDRTVIDTATRETREELGLNETNIKIYGQLPPFLAKMGLKIYPVVGELTSQQFDLNEAEVAKTFTVPITWFIEHPPITGSIETAQKAGANFPFKLVPNYSQVWQKYSEHDVYFYQYDDYVIWGLTAHIVQLFLKTIV